nr:MULTISPECIES: hypothetical protein [Protofrankia]
MGRRLILDSNILIAHDLIIAAHAAETGRIVLSRDVKARFTDLPGVLAVEA